MSRQCLENVLTFESGNIFRTPCIFFYIVIEEQKKSILTLLQYFVIFMRLIQIISPLFKLLKDQVTFMKLCLLVVFLALIIPSFTLL